MAVQATVQCLTAFHFISLQLHMSRSVPYHVKGITGIFNILNVTRNMN